VVAREGRVGLFGEAVGGLRPLGNPRLGVALRDALDGGERLADVGDVGVREPEADEHREVHAFVVVEALHLLPSCVSAPW
jgi:hypothetical protein